MPKKAQTETAQGFEIQAVRHPEPEEPLAGFQESPQMSEVFGMEEMPHLELNKDVAGHHFGLVDLRIERYPLNREEKNWLLQAARQSGVLARFKNGWIVFGPGEEVRLGTRGDLDRLPRLPNSWMTYMVSEANEHLPDPKESGQEFAKTATIHAMRMDEPFLVQTKEGPVSGKSGDFLAKGIEGEMWPIDRQIFLQTHAPAEAPQMGKVFKRK